MNNLVNTIILTTKDFWQWMRTDYNYWVVFALLAVLTLCVMSVAYVFSTSDKKYEHIGQIFLVGVLVALSWPLIAVTAGYSVLASIPLIISLSLSTAVKKSLVYRKEKLKEKEARASEPEEGTAEFPEARLVAE
jgi:hypothetical protein